MVTTRILNLDMLDMLLQLQKRIEELEKLSHKQERVTPDILKQWMYNPNTFPTIATC